MDEPLRWIDVQSPALAQKLVEWSNINSGSRNLSGLGRMREALEGEFATLGGEMRRASLPPLEEIDSGGHVVREALGEALIIRKRLDAPIRVLLSIHYDTVFAPTDPFQRATIENDICRGPGVVDAKGGILVMLTALRAFEQSPLAAGVGWDVLLNPDEEIGSPGSAGLLREFAGNNHLGLVFEPAMPDGSLVGDRKGSGTFTAVVRGRSAHAGRDFASGRSAILALADLIMRIDAIQGRLPGTTINCGKIEGGGATNIVPELAIARFNVRINTHDQQQAITDALENAVRESAKRDGITIHLHGGFASPPKPLDPRSAKLMDDIIATGQELGLSLRHVASGGTCDGNKLAAAGLPVVDSLGPVGGELHSEREYVRLPSLVERAKLTALLLLNLAAGKMQVP